MKSRDSSKGTIIVKHFSCVISSELKIFARCKKHVSYFTKVYLSSYRNRSVYSMADKLLKSDKFLSFLMTVKIDFETKTLSKVYLVF